MPTRAQHPAQANRNRTLYEALGAQDVAEREWLVVLLFYAVLHVVEAWFANYGIHAKTHGERDARISTHPDLRVIYGRYRQLRIDSRHARFNCWRPPPAPPPPGAGGPPSRRASRCPSTSAGRSSTTWGRRRPGPAASSARPARR